MQILGTPSGGAALKKRWSMAGFNKEFPADENPDFKDQESDSDTTWEPSSCGGQTSSEEDIDCSHVEIDKGTNRF